MSDHNRAFEQSSGDGFNGDAKDASTHDDDSGDDSSIAYAARNDDGSTGGDINDGRNFVYDPGGNGSFVYDLQRPLC